MNVLLAFALCAAPLHAEAPPQTSTATARAEEPQAVFSPAIRLKDEPVHYAQAISLAFGATFFTEVRISTSGAVTDLSRLAHDGFYKRELIELLLISAKGRKPLADLAKRRKKGEALRAIAKSCGVDYDAVYAAALDIESYVDDDYLPHFPQRRSRPQRNPGDYWYQP